MDIIPANVHLKPMTSSATELIVEVSEIIVFIMNLKTSNIFGW